MLILNLLGFCLLLQLSKIGLLVLARVFLFRVLYKITIPIVQQLLIDYSAIIRKLVVRRNIPLIICQ